MKDFDLDNNLLNNLTEFQHSFATYLQTNHLGNNKPITSKKLRAFGSDVIIRETVHALRVAGVPICSGSRGYWFAENETDVYDSIRSMRSRVTKMNHAVQGLIDAHEHFYWMDH